MNQLLDSYQIFIYYWNITKSWWDFSDLDLIFKVRAAKNNDFFFFLSAQYLVNQSLDFYQIFMDIIGTLQNWLDFGDLDLIFKVTVVVKLYFGDIRFLWKHYYLYFHVFLWICRWSTTDRMGVPTTSRISAPERFCWVEECWCNLLHELSSATGRIMLIWVSLILL